MILLAVLIGMTAALYPLSYLSFGNSLQALLRNFDIAREQFQRVAGTHWYELELTATDNLTLQPVRGKFPVVGGVAERPDRGTVTGRCGRWVRVRLTTTSIRSRPGCSGARRCGWWRNGWSCGAHLALAGQPH